MNSKTVIASLGILSLLLLNGCDHAWVILNVSPPAQIEFGSSHTSESPMDMAEQNDKYGISILPYTLAGEHRGQDDFEMYIVQVHGMCDEQLQSRINEALISASTSWIDGSMLGGEAALPIIYHQSSRYLSIRNIFEFEMSRIYAFVCDYITIDISTGTRVFLNDLVNTNDEFIELIRQPGIALASENTMQFDGNAENLWKWLAEMPVSEIERRLADCSRDQQAIIDESNFSLDGSIGSVLFRDNFYIEQDKLILVFGGWDLRVTLALESIEQFLLVEKW